MRNWITVKSSHDMLPALMVSIGMPAQKKEFMYATCQITAGMKCLLMHFRCCWKMATRVGKHDQWTHDGNWFGMPGKQHSLKNQVIGVISFGRIARAYIEKIKPLCNNIWVYDNHDNVEAIRAAGAEPKTLEEIYAGADYISLDCPLTPETHHMNVEY